MGPKTPDAHLLAIFLEELEERVRALNDDVLALDKEADSASGPPPAERLTTLLRTAHSLKGAARAVNVRPIERASHHLEEILLAVRDGRLAVAHDLCSLLLAAADAIAEAGTRLRAERDVEGGAITALLPRLEATATSIAGATVAAPPPTRVPERAPGDAAAGEGSVRVAAERLDALLAHTGELRVARRRVESRQADLVAVLELAGRCGAEWSSAERSARALVQAARGTPALPRRVAWALGRAGETLRRLEADLERLVVATEADARLLAQTAGPLEEDVHRVRMLPFAEACAGLERTARDLARTSGKEVELVVRGGEVELDRSVIEGLKDPLRHLVRNAVDHGVEPPAERCAAGKPPRAHVSVVAAPRGTHVEVTVADDGRGLDLAGLREQARQQRLAVPADERELARLVFEPGLSTARVLSDVSGRGVGLDVVKSWVESLHGTVEIAPADGPGTRFTLSVPLTLTTIRVLLVGTAGRIFAFASTNVAELLRLGSGDLRSVQGREMLPRGAGLVPVARLANTLGLGVDAAAPATDKAPAVVLSAGERRVAFVVDELLAAQDVVIKGLGPRLRRVAAVSGATILPSGRIALVLNAAHLVHRALGSTPTSGLVFSTRAAPEVKKRVLLVDDSITTRALERSLLEAAGYDVTVAVDGATAWQLLENAPPDLVVSDVEMPTMDGFALTAAIRGSARLRNLPVVLVTGRERAEDKARGMEAGANAYLLKSAFDQKSFLDAIAQLL
ncbi:MAG TPA: hybrid sensor histidine kinase/response regulator [Verrucomicrobiae bacterium]|nr:hybrid sensor histidine kinase/response regulator [Verrucomicrobiae bacterium]